MSNISGVAAKPTRLSRRLQTLLGLIYCRRLRHSVTGSTAAYYAGTWRLHIYLFIDVFLNCLLKLAASACAHCHSVYFVATAIRFC